jgi:hypothetical protein
MFILENYKEFKEGGKTYTAEEIVEYIKRISDNPETDVPDFYLDKIRESEPTFILKHLSIQKILDGDPSLKEYVESGEDRYEDSEYQPHWEELDNPIVIFNGEVIDGYNRTSIKHRSGEETIKAYVSI